MSKEMLVKRLHGIPQSEMLGLFLQLTDSRMIRLGKCVPRAIYSRP